MLCDERRVRIVQSYREKLGTNLLISAPPEQPSKKLVSRISEIICNIEEIREAHFPMVLSVGASKEQMCVLFLVFNQARTISGVLASIDTELKSINGDGMPFDVWPISQSDSLLETIRSANCVIGWRD